MLVPEITYRTDTHSGRSNNNSGKHTLRLRALDPLSVCVVTSKVVADSLVDSTVVVQSTVQNVRKHAALRRNGGGVVPFIKIVLHFNRAR